MALQKEYMHTLGYSIEGECVYIKLHRGGSLFIIARPRYGKGGIAKPLAVAMSKLRPVIIFDYRGEWKEHITKYNIYSDMPCRLTDYENYENYTFKLSQYNKPADFIALGFEYDQCMHLTSLINYGFRFFKDDIIKFMLMLKDLPTKVQDLGWYNSQYRVKLWSPLAFASKVSLINHFNFVKQWFWQGKHDRRKIYDWEHQITKNRNIIINLRLSETETNELRARAFAGKILQLIRRTHIEKKPFIVFEEARFLAPNIAFKQLPSSTSEILDLVTTFPKQGVSCCFLLQSISQIHPIILSSAYAQKIYGKMDFTESAELEEISKAINADVREFCYVDANSKRHFFVPFVPGCMYESDI